MTYEQALILIVVWLLPIIWLVGVLIAANRLERNLKRSLDEYHKSIDDAVKIIRQ